jgi:hypothetical protein
MATVDVKSLGASGDGVIDDTAAFNKALRSAKDGKLFFQQGHPTAIKHRDQTGRRCSSHGRPECGEKVQANQVARLRQRRHSRRNTKGRSEKTPRHGWRMGAWAFMLAPAAKEFCLPISTRAKSGVMAFTLAGKFLRRM